MRPRVNTRKHILNLSLFAVASGAINNQNLAVAVIAPDANTAGEVREGAIISAVYVEMWLTSDDTAAGTCITTLEKIPANGASMTAANSAALDSYKNKNNIFHIQQGLLAPNIQYPTAVIKGWFKIPRGKQRFALGDSLVLNTHGQSNGLAGCGFVLYKEQF